MQNQPYPLPVYSDQPTRREWVKIVAGLPCCYLIFPQAGSAQAAAGQDWLRFHYTQTPRDLEEIFHQLRQLPDRLTRICGVQAVVKPVNVLVFENRQGYLAHLDKTLPNAPRRNSLFVVRAGRPTILISQGKSFVQDLFHEAVHALNYSTFQTALLPLWMDEGLAEWMEAPVQQQEKVHGTVLQQLLGDQRQLLPEPLRLPSLELIKSTTRADAVDYAASWAWCRFLSDGKNRCHPIWKRYLYDLKAGQQAGRLSHRLVLGVPDYEKMFLASI